MIKTLEFLSLDEALEFVPDQATVAISILSPGRCAAALHGQFAFLNHWVLTTLVRSAYPHYAFGSMRHTAPTPQKEDPCTSI